MNEQVNPLIRELLNSIINAHEIMDEAIKDIKSEIDKPGGSFYARGEGLPEYPDDFKSEKEQQTNEPNFK